jgi:SagB-type dehydrogenase family enzyme
MASDEQEGRRIGLPKITGGGGFPVEEALRTRRSVREFTGESLDLGTISRLLWAAQGVTEERHGLRTAPSAGATYPLELYVATVKHLARYDPEGHGLIVTLEEDVRTELARAALGQPWVEKAPAVFVFAAVVSRTATRYGERAERYVKIEVGSASENLMLQAVALGLGSVAVGAYDDESVKQVLQLPDEQEVFLIVPVGRPAE